MSPKFLIASGAGVALAVCGVAHAQLPAMPPQLLARPAAAPSPRGAWPKPPPAPAAPQGDTETRPTSRALIAAVTALRDSRFSEARLRGASLGDTRLTLPMQGATMALRTNADAGAPRIGLGPRGGAAVLVKLPATTLGVAGGDPKREPTYALATATATRIKVWAVYSDLPSDKVLSTRMAAALAGAGQPLLTFDPTFKAGAEPNPARYLLK